MDLMRGFKAESLAFIAFFATMPLYSPNLVFYGTDTGSLVEMDWFAPALLVSATVVSLVLVVQALRNPGWRYLARSTIVAASVVYLAGMALFFWLTLNSMPGIVSTVAGVLAAAGSIPIAVAWGTYFSRLGLRQALFQISCMCAVSALFDEFVIAHYSLALVCMLVLVGAAIPLAEACRGTLVDTSEPLDAIDDVFVTRGEGGKAIPAKDCADGSQNPLREVLSKLGSVLLPTFIGIMLFAFTMGLRKILFFGDTVHGEALGAWLAPLALLPLYFLKRDKPLFAFVYQVYLPACAALTILLFSFPSDSVVYDAGLAATYVLYAVIGVLAISSLCAVAHAGEFGPTLVFGLPLFIFSLFSFIGVRAGSISVISDNATAVLVVISTAYFAYLVFSPGWHTWRSMVAPPVDAVPAEPQPGVFEERCDELAEQYSLSPREAEILSYMGHGYAPAYIAKTLLISDSTARSHVRNIYRKVGVSSREELIALFN